MDPLPTLLFDFPPWLQILLLVLFAVSEVLGSTDLVRPNSVIGVIAATLRRLAPILRRLAPILRRPAPSKDVAP